MKELCNCGKMAVWLYLPSSQREFNHFFCDNCVSRGCSCNHHYIKEDEYDDRPKEDDTNIKWIDEFTWTHVDEQGREYPCCEYDYEENGYDMEDDENENI